MTAFALRRAGFLAYAGLQFLVLTTLAMVVYAGGALYDPSADHYLFFHNFLSDLGSTETFAGRSNLPSSILFGIALSTLGAAMVGFAGAWQLFARAGRARAVGVASRVIGTISGIAFVGVAVTPWNLLIGPHSICVVTGFGLLVAYVACITFLLWRNGGATLPIAANLVYCVVLAAYFVVTLAGPSFATEHGHSGQVTAQKVVAYASMLQLLVLATLIRRGALYRE